MPVQEYKGENISVSFDAKRCIHAARCVEELPEVFKTDSDPWIQPDGADATRVAELINRCPSGALTYRRLDGVESEQPPSTNTAALLKNGPIAFHADIDMQTFGSMYRATLCRCGASKNKPFCDGAHTEAGFDDAAQGPATDATPGVEPTGKVAIDIYPDGPLGIKGGLKELDAAGEQLHLQSQMALCRCGASKNKPFCDGAHTAIGFTDKSD